MVCWFFLFFSLFLGCGIFLSMRLNRLLVGVRQKGVL
jgi:hypothetical protein